MSINIQTQGKETSNIEILNTTIDKNSSFILTQGSLNIVDLLAEAYDVLVLLGVNKELRDQILAVYVIEDKTFKPEESLTLLTKFNLAHIHEQKYEQANALWHEEIFNYFNTLAPEGYYFGSSEGDASLMGWFKTHTI